MASDQTNGTVRRDVATLPPGRNVAYPGAPPDVRVPNVPTVEIRDNGFWGGQNRQDKAHEARLFELRYLADEVDFAEAAGTAIEVNGIKIVRDGVAKAESIVYATPADSVAGMLASDLTSDMTARARIRHSRYMELYDTEAMNVLHRR